MYYMFKKDPWGNNVPYMAADKPIADKLLKEKKELITLVVEVPRNVQTLIKM